LTVRIGKVLFDDWISLELPDGCSDTFIFRMSVTAGQPPADYARVIRSLIPAVRKLRRSASVWVQIYGHDGEGRWFGQAARRSLWGLAVPFAVTDGIHPQIWDFSYFPWVDREPMPRPPAADPYLKGKTFSNSALGSLRVLARADCAYTAEVASLAGFSRSTVRETLRTLAEKGYVQRIMGRRYPYWQLRRKGLSTALRSWGLPPGCSFLDRKERGFSACIERSVPRRENGRVSTGKHRRTARLWLAWLRKAWPQAEVWAGWTEVYCERTRPDALCWGILDGCETLFWLEAEGGKDSSENLQRKTLRRVNRALVYARSFKVRLVFVLLAPPWVCKVVVQVFRDLPDDIAVVIEDWKAFGELPVPAWGKVRWG
jgi:hypothetical protein